MALYIEKIDVIIPSHALYEECFGLQAWWRYHTLYALLERLPKEFPHLNKSEGRFVFMHGLETFNSLVDKLIPLSNDILSDEELNECGYPLSPNDEDISFEVHWIDSSRQLSGMKRI